MTSIAELTNIDYPYVFTAIFIILTGIKAITTLSEWLIHKLGIETRWMKSKREDHELLIQTVQNLTELQERHLEDIQRSDRHDEEIERDIKKLTDMFLDKQIDDMRWEINHFATQAAEGKPCNKDSYKHCFYIYNKYEKLLSDHHLENGEVEISMKIINDSYQRKLMEGF